MTNHGFHSMIVKLNLVTNNPLLSKNIKSTNHDSNPLSIRSCGQGNEYRLKFGGGRS